MTFENIIGHNAVKQQLKNIVTDGRLSHAYIFCGPKGIGKYTAAKAWADMITQGSAADITEITNEQYHEKTKSQQLSVETVRKASSDMYLRPYNAEKRVFIIPNGESMTVSAQNAMLKVFEEPPEYCVIIIITDNYESLLQTIRSRAIKIMFNSLSDSEISEYLVQKGCKPDPAVTALANGSILRASELVESKESLEIINKLFVILPKFFGGDMRSTYELIGFLQKNKAYCDLIFDIFILFFEQSLLQLCEKNVTIPVKALNGVDCARLITVTEHCRKALKSNVNYNMAVSELVLSLREGCNK